MRHVLNTLPYQLCTTEFVQEEAKRGGEQLKEATQAMETGEIYVHPINQPPLDTAVPELPSVHRTDRSLAICAHRLGGIVLTHDKKLQRYCSTKNIAWMSLDDFLVQAEQNGWLSAKQIQTLRMLAGLL